MKYVLKTLRYSVLSFFSVKGLLGLIIVLLCSILIARGHIENNQILSILPTILGIIIAGSLSTLAIMVAHINNNEMDAFLQKKYAIENPKDYYSNFVEYVFRDISLIIVAFIISIFMLILSNINDIPGIVYPFPNFEKLSLYTAIDIFLVTFSILAIIDLVWSIYELMCMRYELADKLFKDKLLSTIEQDNNRKE